MTKPELPEPIPLPLLLAYGKPTSPDLPQAAWFRSDDRLAVSSAAHALKLSVVTIGAELGRPLLAGVHEGLLKGNGQMIVGSVTAEVFQRIEDHVRAQGEAAESANIDATNVDAGKAGEDAMKEQNINIGSTKAVAGAAAKTGSISPSPAPWDTLRVGARVLAAYWGEAGEFEGFWLASVKRIEAGEFTLEWFEAPEYPPFKTPPKNIAVPHPEFRPSGK